MFFLEHSVEVQYNYLELVCYRTLILLYIYREEWRRVVTGLNGSQAP